MNRAAALSYLQSEYEALSVEANTSTDADLRAYGIVTDQALRVLGIAEAVISSTDVIDTLVPPYIALLDYFALRRYCRLFAMRTSVTIDRMAVNGSQLFDQVEKLRAEAELRCDDLGYSPKNGYSMGRLTLDFLEPGLGPEFTEGMVW